MVILEKTYISNLTLEYLSNNNVPLLIKQEDVDIPIFDTTTIHSVYAVEFPLAN
ncbi:MULTISPECIES: hypothetical protein [unclassified Clostridium]|uniref:hypothetical protein n=1 Tax=unclassified Clostridium TaxID=2614128 RepID=UPI00029754C2|nr:MULTISPECIES: hypothetical protein [unclassified Clostridium]EKQ53091.1 MAG: hypothetical protein A370_03943 [Clostridium sp. Maddingley MBC34-26]